MSAKPIAVELLEHEEHRFLVELSGLPVREERTRKDLDLGPHGDDRSVTLENQARTLTNDELDRDEPAAAFDHQQSRLGIVVEVEGLSEIVAAARRHRRPGGEGRQSRHASASVWLS